MMAGKRISAIFVFILLVQVLTPLGAIGVASASTSPSTQISIAGNYLEGSDGIVISNSSIEISFNVTVPSGSFTQGTFTYSGVVQGNGSFNETGTTVEISSNSSGSVIMTYFANSTNGSEVPKQLGILFDLSAPTPSISPFTNSTLEVSESITTITASGSGEILVSCSDQTSSVESMRVLRSSDQIEILVFNESASEQVGVEQLVSVSQDGITNLTLSCSDYFQNVGSIDFSLQIDITPPALDIQFSQPIDESSCLPPTWSLSLTAVDSSPPIQLEYSIDNQSTWGGVSNPFTPPLSFSGSLFLSGTDSVGNANIDSVTIPGFDQEDPQISVVTSENDYTISFWDDCDTSPNVVFRWESTNGTSSAWNAISNNGTTVTAPEEYRITGYRIVVVASDFSSRSTTEVTEFTPGFGTPISINLESISHLAFSHPEVSLAISNPSNLEYYLSVTQDSASLENIHANNSSYSRDFDFEDGSEVTILINSTHLDSTNQTSEFSYTIDGTVGTLPALSLTGTTVVINGTTMASPTTYVSLSNLTDDAGGVGYSGAECRNGNSSWATVTGASFAIPSQPDSETGFSIECRITDLLGNTGDSSWANGTVDALAPTVSTNIIQGQIITNLISISILCEDNSEPQPNFLDIGSNSAGIPEPGIFWLSSDTMPIANLNLSDSGSYEIDIWCIDSLGNEGVLELNNLIFLISTPGVSIVYFGNDSVATSDGTNYASQGAGANIVLTRNGHTNVSISVTIQSEDGYSSQYQFSNSSTLSLSNLSDGEYQINASVCGSDLCHNSSSSVIIDTTAPQEPQNWISSEGAVISTNLNLTILAGQDLSIRPVIGADNGAPLDEISCQLDNGSTGSFSIQLDSTSWWNPWSWDEDLDGGEAYLSCIVLDIVNNSSPEFSTFFSFDFLIPEIDAGIVSGYVVSDWNVSISCNDASEIDNLLLISYEDGESEIQLSEEFAGNYGQLIPDAENGESIGIRIQCTDAYGNSNLTPENTLIMINSLNGTGFETTHTFDSGAGLYMGNGSSVIVSPQFPLGSISLVGTSMENETWSTQFSAANGEFLIESEIFNGMNENFSSTISFLELTHLLPNSQISDSTNIGTVIWENSSTSIISVGQTYLANGSSTDVLTTSSICGSFDIIYSIGDSSGSFSIESSIFSITMPEGNSSSLNLEVVTTDCLGNSNAEVWVLTRDMIAPNFGSSGDIGSMISDGTEILIWASDDSGLNYRNISFSYGNTTQQVCLNLTSECYVTVGDIFALEHDNTVIMEFELLTNSGQVVSENRTFLIDMEVGNWWLDYSDSTNIYGMHVSTHSIIKFQFEEQMSIFCVEHTVQGIGQGCWSEGFSAVWSLGGEEEPNLLEVQISLTDALGNTHSEYLDFNYSNQAPVLESSEYILSQPGWVDFEIIHPIPVSLVIAEGANIQNTSNSSAYFENEGVFSENITFTDQTGNVLFASNVSVIIDSTSPEVNLTISDSFFVGTETWINVTSTDIESSISSWGISLVGPSGLGSCSFNFEILGQPETVTKSRQISQIIEQSGCGLPSDTNYSLSIFVYSSNGAGIETEISEAGLGFVGEIDLDSIWLSGTMLIPINEFDAIVSNFSTIWCDASHLVPIEISISVLFGNYTSLGSNSIQWQSGDGSLSCDISDGLGNSAQKWFNVTFVENDLGISSEILNGGGNFTRHGSENFGVTVTTSYQLTGVEVFSGNTSIAQTYSNNFTINLANNFPTGGEHSIRVMASNELGHFHNHSFQLFLDNSIPSFEILEGESYILDVNQNVLLSTFGVVTYVLSATDLDCPGTPAISAQNASQIIQNGSEFYITMPTTASSLEIAISDCVGWEDSGEFQIERYSIPSPQLSFQNSILLNGTHAILPNLSTISVIQTYPGILGMELGCNVDSGMVNCPQNGSNRWTGSIEIDAAFSGLTLLFSDLIGNTREVTISLELDETPPECVFPESVVVGGSHFLIDISNTEIVCSDSQTSPEWAEWDEEGGSGHGFIEGDGGEIREFIDLSSGPKWTIVSEDVAGNEWMSNFTFFEDQIPPEVHCRPSRLDYFPTNIHSPGNESIHCSISDLIPISFNYTFTRLGGVIGQGQGITKTVVVGLPDVSDGDEILLKITVEDLLGNQNFVTFQIYIDDVSPNIFLTTYSESSRAMPEDTVDALGTIGISAPDDNLESIEVDFYCEEESGSVSFSQGFNLANVSEYIREGCEIISVSVEAIDRAGNSHRTERDFRIDWLPPEIEIGSSCYFDEQTEFHVMSGDCVLFIDISDDSMHNSSSWARVGNNTFEFGTPSFEIDLSEFVEMGINTSFRLEVADDSGKETVIERVLRMSDLSILNAYARYCNPADGIYCEEDYVVISAGEHTITVVNPHAYNRVPMVQSIGTCRHPGECQFFSNGSFLSFNSSELEEGLHVIDVISLDVLGRISSLALEVWIDLSAPEWVSLDSSPLVNTQPPQGGFEENTHPVCENPEICVFEFTIREDSGFEISGDFINQPNVVKGEEGEWRISIPLTPDNIRPNSDDSMNVSIHSHSGHEYSLGVPIEWVETNGLRIRTSVSECLDGQNFVGEWGAEDVICLYDHDKLESGRLNLGFSIEANFEVGYTLMYEQNFSNLIPGFGISNQFYSGQYVPWDIPILEERPPDSWMNYSIKYHLETSQAPREVIIHLVRTDAARPIFGIPDDAPGSTNIVRETGAVNIEALIEVDGNLPEISGLSFRAMSLLEALRMDMASAICEWELTIVSVHSGMPENRKHISPCNGVVTIQLAHLRIELPENSLEAILGDSGHGDLPLFMVSKAELRISFTHSDTEQNYSIDMEIDAYLEESGPSPVKFPVGVNYCQDSIDENTNWLENSIDWALLRQCLAGSSSEDILTHVGLMMKWYEPLSPKDERMAVALCPISSIPNSFEEWWGTESDQRCIVLGAIPDENQKFLSVKLEAVGCTLRCSLEGASEENIQVFQTDEIVLNLGSGRFADPGINEEWGGLSWIVLALFLIGIVVREIWVLFSGRTPFSRQVRSLRFRTAPKAESREIEDMDSVSRRATPPQFPAAALPENPHTEPLIEHQATEED